MVDDFTMRVGTNFEIDVVTTLYSAAIAKAISSALIVCEFTSANGTPVLTKKTTDTSPTITVSENPLATSVTTLCTAVIEILPADAQYLVPGSYTYEVAATISGVRQVIYPLGDDTASFTVYDSKTWNVATHEPLEPNPMHPAVRKAAVLNAARRKT